MGNGPNISLTFGGANPRLAHKGLVLVHGRGGSAADIMGLGRALALPNLAFVAPEAPNNTWWPTSFLAPMGQMTPFVDHGIAAVIATISALESQGLSRDRIAIAGFSQGGCLALEYGARMGDGMAGIFGLSAGLIGTEDTSDGPDDALYGFAPKQFDYTARLTGMPVAITVHDQDPHIPLKRAQDSAAVFEKLGANVMFDITAGAGHAITQAGITALRAALNC